ncbi:MAG TPA: DinB family protein [Pyrinomonadaceae bacterium]|nr:DinB family protein [Pyrinomonadaceae bacterium]
MNEQLDKLIRDARTIVDDARSSFGKLSATQLNWKPSAERWSIAQCFEHLITSNQGYLPIIESVRTGTKKTTFWERLPVLPGLAGKMLIKSLDPASTRKLKAPKRFAPAQSNISASVIDDFAAQQDKIIEGMTATGHLDLEKIVVTSPAVSSGVVAYSLMDAYRIIVVHEQRHFQQAKRVTAEPGFPNSA